MSNYAVRVTRSASALSKVYEKLDSQCESVIVYEHPDEGNVHCHMLLLVCEVSTDTLKNYIRKVVGNVERTEWSFKSGADKDFISYMSKGKYDPVHLFGLGADEIAVYKAKGYDKKAIRLEDGHLVKPIKAGLKKTKRELVELMVTKIDVPSATPNQMMHTVRSVLVANNEVVGCMKSLEYIESMMMYGDKTRWVDNMMYLYNRRYGM